MENIDRGGPLSSTVQAPPPIDNHQYEDSRRESYPAIDRPPNLSRHETTRQNTDALQKPDSAKNDEDCGDDIECDFQMDLVSLNYLSGQPSVAGPLWRPLNGTTTRRMRCELENEAKHGFVLVFAHHNDTERSVVKEHPHKSPHSRVNRASFQGIGGL